MSASLVRFLMMIPGTLLTRKKPPGVHLPGGCPNLERFADLSRNERDQPQADGDTDGDSKDRKKAVENAFGTAQQSVYVDAEARQIWHKVIHVGFTSFPLE